MPLTPLQKQVFRVLKGAGKPLTVSAIGFALVLKDQEFLDLLHTISELVSLGLLKESQGRYWPAVYLDPPLKKDDLSRKVGDAWEWESIQQEIAPEGKPEQAEPFRNPFEKYLPHGWSQNGRGSCTGHAGAIMMQCTYYGCTGDFPTDEEISQHKPDLTIDLGACVMTYDQWYRTVFSAQWCYHIGRVHGNVQYPSGGYTKSVVQAMQKYGAVPWDTCLTPKQPTCAPLTYPLSYEDTLAKAAIHKIDGYAVITTFEGVMDAIETSPSHCVNMATNLEEDYTNPSPGNIWKVHVGAEKAGSHALPWVFVDRAKGLIGCWNSWGNTEFPQTCWIDKRYWEENCSPGYVPLDKDEVVIGKEIYIKVQLTANVACTFTVTANEVSTTYTGTTTLSLERGQPYLIVAVPVDPSTVNEASLQQEILLTDEPGPYLVNFTFTKKVVVPVSNLRERILKLIAEILKKFKRTGNDPGETPGEPSGRKETLKNV